METALEKHLTPATGRPGPLEAGREESKLNVSVVFTSVESTLEAIRHAGVLASRLPASITLLVPQVVPYPLPLSTPPVLIDWNERRFRAIAEASPVETAVCVYLCRDREQALLNALAPHSVVVIGGPSKWWPFTAEKRLARVLRSAGHEVALVETE